VRDDVTIGVLWPGAMGSALARVWERGGARVVSTVAGRSARTQALAAGLELLPGLAEVVEVSDIVVSIGPPDRAVDFASAIAEACRAAGRQPLVADLNAISPHTVALVTAELDPVGCELLDGSISGGPPTDESETVLYLSGPGAERLAEASAAGLRTRILGPRAGTASALKMCTASMYKGFTGLLLQALLTADAHGVAELVLADLADSFGHSARDAPGRLALAASKSDRYPGEMREISETQREAGVGGELFAVMAEVFERLAATELADLTPEQAAQVSDLGDVLARAQKSLR
jgi:3-hydroxyisobutyrate dehydrogenase-like beta-hydroxyacid dehydrogenase